MKVLQFSSFFEKDLSFYYQANRAKMASKKNLSNTVFGRTFVQWYCLPFFIFDDIPYEMIYNYLDLSTFNSSELFKVGKY